MRIGLRWANSFAVRPFKTVIYTVGTKGILSCLLLHFTLTLPAQSFDVLDDQAFTGPLQKVSVNVTVNDKVPCASPVIRLINPPAAAVGKTELKGVYIEFTPTNATINQNVTIQYGIKCGATEKTATLTIRVTQYNNPANIVPSNIVCYDELGIVPSFSPTLKYITRNNSTISDRASQEVWLDGFTMPLVGDINGDGKPEIVALGLGLATNMLDYTDGKWLEAREWYIHIFDGQTGVRIRSVNMGQKLSDLRESEKPIDRAWTEFSDMTFLDHDGITSKTDEDKDQFQTRYVPRHNSPGHLAIADLDNDGVAEIVVAETGSKGRLYALKPTIHPQTRKIEEFSKFWYAKEWNGSQYNTVSYKYPITGNHEHYGAGVPYIADLNADGHSEVIIYNKIYDGETGALVETLETLDEFGYTESESTNNTYFNNYAFVGRRPSTHQKDDAIPCMAIADIDKDGYLDIAAGSKVYTMKSVYNANLGHDVPKLKSKITGPRTITARRGNANNENFTCRVNDGFTAVADIDMDGNLDVIVFAPAENIMDDVTKFLIYVWTPTQSPTTPKAATYLYARSATGTYSYPFVGDINGRLDDVSKTKRLPEICLVTGRLWSKGGWNTGATGEHTGSKISTHPLATKDLTTDFYKDGSFNVDGNTSVWGHVLAFTYYPNTSTNNNNIHENLKLSWAMEHKDRSASTGITMFDFDNDGIMELVYRDEFTLRVISPAKKDFVSIGETASNVVRFNQAGVRSFTGHEAPVIADVNMDGSADILTMAVDPVLNTGNTSETGLTRSFVYVFEHATNQPKWAPCPPVWNQVIYHPLLINPDLTVPARPQSMLTAYQHPNGYTIYPYNTQWVQVPIVKAGDPNYKTVVLKSDAVIKNMKVNVESSSSTKVTLTILNKGSASISSDAHITFYDGGTTGAGVIGTNTKKSTQKVGVDIFPNEQKDLFYTLTGFNYNGHLIWARIMDNNGTFVEAGQTDCDDTNNVMGASQCPNFKYTAVAERTTFCGTGDQIRLEANSDQGTVVTNPSFKWYHNGTEVPNGNTKVYYATATGEYTCYVIDQACRDYSTAVNITLYNPVAKNYYAVTIPQTPVTVDVLAHDPWAANCKPTLAVVEQPKHGVAAPNGTGDRMVYTPNGGFAGIDSLKWSSSANGMTETGKVYIIVLDGADEYYVCRGGNITLSFQSISDVQLYWYTAQTGETPAQTGSSFSKALTNVTAPQTLWVEARWKGQKFARRNVEVRLTPMPIVDPVPPQTACPGDQLNINFSGTNATGYEYTVAGDNIGLSNGTGDISTTVTNTGNTSLTATVQVTPKNGSCPGTPVNFTITVNPPPVINDTTITVCSGSPFSITPIDGVHGDAVPNGTKYTWTVTDNTNVTGETNNPNSPENDINNGNLSNITSSIQTVTYSVTPQAAGCSGASFQVTVNILSAAMFRYPDVRIYACSVAGNINLSKFLDTLNVSAIKWTGKAVSPPITAKGIIDGSLLHDGATYIYEYETTNRCINNSRNKVYLHVINRNKDFRLRIDTVAVCYMNANNLQLNRMFGLDDGSTITHTGGIGVDQYISRVTAPSIYDGAMIFNGYDAYNDQGVLPSINYRGDANAQYIEFEYQTQQNGCMKGKKYKIVVVLTSS